MDGVNCDEFKGDDIAQAAGRLSTRDAMNPDMLLEEVILAKIAACVTRRSLRTDSFGRKLVVDSTTVDYTINANINNLGSSDPTAVYNSMVNSLSTAITSGNYSTALQMNAAGMGSATLAGADVTSFSVSNFTTATVVAPSSGSDSDSSDDVPVGLIVGVVVGVTAFLVIVAVAVFYLFFKEQSPPLVKTEEAASGAPTSPVGKVGGSGVKKTGTINTEDVVLETNPMKKSGGKAGKGATESYGGL